MSFSMQNWVEILQDLLNQNKAVVVATVSSFKGSTPREVGAKMLITSSGEFYGTVGGGNLESLVLEEAREIFKTRVSKTVEYPLGAKADQCCGGVVEVLFEMVGCPQEVILFGVGHVGQEVYKLLSGLGFFVKVCDERPEWLEKLAAQKFSVKAGLEQISENSYVVIMTHSHDLDLEILAQVLKLSFFPKYVGLIGSENKWNTFQRKLAALEVSEIQIKKVHCPIGLPIGGKSPMEVAVSLAAEFIQIKNKQKNES